ncbi:MAG: hypothetical protein JNM18_23985 [Planctomycetaceae bacterium]|nr:hypothetical protein [Planctomycetaceae bacterium]
MKHKSAFWTTLSIAVLLGQTGVAIANDVSVAPPPDFTKRVAALLPESWVCENDPKRLIIRPLKNPVFVNLVGTSGRANETLDDYYKRHTVQVDYRITMRFGPMLSDDQVQHIIKQNESIYAKLQTVERHPLVRQLKGGFEFPRTPDGQTLFKEYEELKQSIRTIPDGYFGDVSVYVEPTHLGYARFLHKASEQECEAVRKLLIAQLKPYTAFEPERR